MIGVAIGLGNFWRFPYMVGRYGGAAFVVFYLLAVVAVGVPALMAEWGLGRHTRRGPVGAFARAGVPFGRGVGWFFFVIVLAATAYYSVAVGWVVAFAAGAVVNGVAALVNGGGAAIGGASALAGGASSTAAVWDPATVLPPETGFDPASFFPQLGFTALVVVGAALVLGRGLRGGIERVSRAFIPVLVVILFVLIARAVTLPGAGDGLRWYLLKFRPADLTPGVMLAATGQAVFSLALGGTFMVVYGSYLDRHTDLRSMAVWTAAADTTAGLLAGLAIFPAVFALGLEPASGPGLIFETLPRVFAAMPGGAAFAALLFSGLLAGAALSDIAALEVLVAALTDNTRLRRRHAVWTVAGAVMLVAVPPMTSMRVFVPWDLTFGSGMQTFGALCALLAFGWALDRGRALAELRGTRVKEEVGEGEREGEARAGTATGSGDGKADLVARGLYLWIRFVVPAGIAAVGVWWAVTEVGSG